MLFFNRLTAGRGGRRADGAGGSAGEARTKKGDKYLATGRASEARRSGRRPGFLRKALFRGPSDMVYQMAAEKARFQGRSGARR